MWYANGSLDCEGAKFDNRMAEKYLEVAGFEKEKVGVRV